MTKKKRKENWRTNKQIENNLTTAVKSTEICWNFN